MALTNSLTNTIQKRQKMKAIGTILVLFMVTAGCSTATPPTTLMPVSSGDMKLACMQTLRGTWEGMISANGMPPGGWGRTLVLLVREDKLYANYGITGIGVSPVNISFELTGEGCRPTLRFLTQVNTAVTLTLLKDGWLSGTFRLGEWDPKPMNLKKVGR